MDGLIVKLKKIFENFTKKMVWKIAMWGWLLILLSISIFLVYIIPLQKANALERMDTEANDIINSFLVANSSPLVTENYSLVVDHSQELVKASKSILYLVITKKDGYSMIYTKDGWKIDNLSGMWLPDTNTMKGSIIYNPLVKNEVFHKPVRFTYLGIYWGIIHIGLSLDKYNSSVQRISMNLTWLTIVIALIGFLVSAWLARIITKPILILDRTTRQITDGNLNVEAKVKTRDELESLASSFNQMTSSLRIARDNLEAKVLERTSQLEDTNRVLKREISERKKAETSLQKYTMRLEGLQEIYKSIIQAKSAQEIVFETLVRLQSQISDFTNAYLLLFNQSGYNENIHIFTKSGGAISVGKESANIDIIRESNNDLPELIWENKLSNKSDINQIESFLQQRGFESYMRLLLKFKNDLIGELIFVSPNTENFTYDDCTTCFEISKQLAVAFVQSNLQESLVIQARDLQNSLMEKEVLLKEIHHRVKNNLQIITSLLNLQSQSIPDEENKSIFRDSQNRIKSMALVHEKLYQSADLSKIDLNEYVKNLSDYVKDTYSAINKNVKLELQITQIELQVDTIVPLGLILNELISNSFKYAFPKDLLNHHENKISTFAEELDDNSYCIEVSDNGKGLPEDFDIEQSQSLGLKLVYNLCMQIEAELKVESNNGTKFSILLPK